MARKNQYFDLGQLKYTILLLFQFPSVIWLRSHLGSVSPFARSYNAKPLRRLFIADEQGIVVGWNPSTLNTR